jgi:hypothetical protein
MLIGAFGLAVLAGLWPVALAAILTFLDRAPPLRSAWAYLAGAGVVIAISTVAFLCGLSAAGATPRKRPGLSAGVTLALGLLMLVFAYIAARWQPRGREGQRRPRGTGARAAFALGFVMWLPSPVYLAALKRISDGGFGVVKTAAYSTVAALLLLWIIEMPVALYLFSPAAARRLHAVDRWMKRHGRAAVVVLSGVVGVFLSVEGVVRLIRAG